MTLATGQVMIFLSKRLRRSQTPTSMTIYGNTHPKKTFALLIMISNHHQKISNHQSPPEHLKSPPDDVQSVDDQVESPSGFFESTQADGDLFQDAQELGDVVSPTTFSLKLGSFLVLIVLTDASFTTFFING